ncbi:MAG: ethanolamine ammonia-lyase reactivating factor EutA [Chloroflexi bacterium]|nr:ethanolamine ammonia-lyase reactivating factor EutA [Chloroflexota bacterium]
MDVGARLVAFQADGIVTRVEEVGRRAAAAAGVHVEPGFRIGEEELRSIAAYMVDELLKELRIGGATQRSDLLRTEPLRNRRDVAAITFSGGVSEFIYGRAAASFGDLGFYLAEEIRARDFGAPIACCNGGIRATVIGASQYTIQVSGSTILVSPLEAVPVRNVPVIAPRFKLDLADLDTNAVAAVAREALRRADLLDRDGPVAVAVHWQGSATFRRIDAFCRGLVDAVGLSQPLILVFDSDIGGLVGLHIRDELDLQVPVISIDGVELREFDYIDIGELLPAAGAVPVVIKSLVFGAR